MKARNKYKVILVIISLLSFLGFLDSAYLTILHYKNAIPPCTVSGCETVLTSTYSTISTLPVSLLGSLFYLALIGYSAILLQKNPKSILDIRIYLLLAIIGFTVSLIFFFIQAFVLKSFCQYCLFSEGISALILILAFRLKTVVK